MNNFKRILSALPLLFAMAATAHAAAPAGAVTQLSGFAMAIKPDGRARIVSAQSKLEVGDTVVSEADSFVRVRLDDGNEAVMGPSTSLKLERFTATETALSLSSGVVHVTGMPSGPARSFTIDAGENHVDAGSASFILTFVPPVPGSAVALRQVYLRSSLAAFSTGVMSDTGSGLGDLVAQNTPLGVAPKAPGVPPGLYVSVLDGAIVLANKGGSTSFTAGQFGYTASPIKPPVLVPANPGIKFTPPPTFASNSGPGGGASKAAAVDCVVR